MSTPLWDDDDNLPYGGDGGHAKGSGSSEDRAQRRRSDGTASTAIGMARTLTDRPDGVTYPELAAALGFPPGQGHSQATSALSGLYAQDPDIVVVDAAEHRRHDCGYYIRLEYLAGSNIPFRVYESNVTRARRHTLEVCRALAADENYTRADILKGIDLMLKQLREED